VNGYYLSNLPIRPLVRTVAAVKQKSKLRRVYGVIQAAMFFLLGCLTAGLVALIILPAIRRRAVRLTRREVAASLPTTYTEIEAQKDQLRAEFAVVNSRLQRRIDDLSQRATRQEMDLNGRTEDVRVLAAEVDEKTAELDDMEERVDRLREELRDTGENLTDVSAKRRDAGRQLIAETEERKRLSSELEELKADLDSRRVDLVAHVTRIETLEDQLADVRAQLSTETAEIASRESDLRMRDAQIATEADKITGLEKKIDRLIAEVADRDDALERRNRDLAQLKTANGSANGGSKARAGVNDVEAESRLIEAESEIARLERLVQELRSGEPEAASKGDDDRANRDAVANQMTALTEERDRLRAEVEVLSRATGVNRDTERAENEMLRQRLTEIAAKVMHMTTGQSPGSAQKQTNGAAKSETKASAETITEDAILTNMPPMSEAPPTPIRRTASVDAGKPAPPVKKDRAPRQAPAPEIRSKEAGAAKSAADSPAIRVTTKDRIKSTKDADTDGGAPAVKKPSAKKSVPSSQKGAKQAGANPNGEARKAGKSPIQAPKAPVAGIAEKSLKTAGKPAEKPRTEKTPKPEAANVASNGKTDDAGDEFGLIDRILQDVEALKESAQQESTAGGKRSKRPSTRSGATRKTISQR